MSILKFSTSKGTKYFLNFEQLDNPGNIEVSFETEDGGYNATNKGEVYEVMGIITQKIKNFLEIYKQKHPQKLRDFELFINPVSEEEEDENGLGETEKNKRTQLYLRYIKNNLNSDNYYFELINNIIAVYYNIENNISYKVNTTSYQLGKPVGYRIDCLEGSRDSGKFWINQPVDKSIEKFIKSYKGDIDSLKKELINQDIKVVDSFSDMLN